MRTRAFRDEIELKVGRTQSEQFNVLRHFMSQHVIPLASAQKEIMGFMESRATLWTLPIKMGATRTDPMVTILLLDPTIGSGRVPWGLVRKWSQPPQPGLAIPGDLNGTAANSLFAQFVHMAKSPDLLKSYVDHTVSPLWIPTQILLYLTYNEWLTTLEYVKSIFNQIELIREFRVSLDSNSDPKSVLMEKLLWCKYMLPAFRDMIKDMSTLQDAAFHTSHSTTKFTPETAFVSDPTTGSHGSDSTRCDDPFYLDLSRLYDTTAELEERTHDTIKFPWNTGLENDINNDYQPFYRIFTNNVIYLSGVWLVIRFIALMLSMTTTTTVDLAESLKRLGTIGIPVLFLTILFYKVRWIWKKILEIVIPMLIAYYADQYADQG